MEYKDHVTEEIKTVENGGENYAENDKVIRRMRHQVFYREKKQRQKAEEDEKERVAKEIEAQRRKRFAFGRARKEVDGMLVTPERL